MAWKPKYITSEEMKAFKRSSDVSDVHLGYAIEAASRAIDIACNRQFGKVDAPEQRFYTARFDRERRRWVVPIDDLMSMSGFAAETQDADGNTVGTISAYFLESRNAAQEGKPWTQLMVRPNSAVVPTGAVNEVAITALWGWTAIPEGVRNACRLQTSRLDARRESPYGVAGSPDLGNELRLLARLDADVEVMVAPFRRWWGAA